MKTFVIELYGTYGGQWYCVVRAENIEEARIKALCKYPEHTLNEFKYADLEISFDNDGISDWWYVAW